MGIAMYIPDAFAEDRAELLRQSIHEQPFAALIVWEGERMIANHLPLLLDAEGGKLVGHVARANPLWQQCAEGAPAIAIFSGVHHYVSPSWYPSKRETGQVVPTWNYAVVHVHGSVRFVHDAQWLHALVTRLTERMEHGRKDRWHVSDAPGDFVERMLGAIVGVELAITRIEGKRKLSQNRPRRERDGVIAGLANEPDDNARIMAEMMRGS